MPSGIVSPSSLPSHNEARKILAKELNLDKTSKFIGYIDRVSREKGIWYLIDAFVQIKDRYPDYHLVLVGDGHYINLFKERIQNDNLQDKSYITKTFIFWCGVLFVMASYRKRYILVTVCYLNSVIIKSFFPVIIGS